MIIKSKPKIGILTWYNHGNIGSALQAYALQEILSRMGYCVEIIAYRMKWNRPKIRPVKTLIKNILCIISEYLPILKRYEDHFRFFYLKNIHFSSVCEEDTIAKIAKKYDAIITGSDQIWSPKSLDSTYLLNFCNKNSVRKIAYAPSFGVSSIPEDFFNLYKSLLVDYDSISVRESTGAAILNKMGFDVEVVADPTLLLQRQFYESIEHQVREIDSEYIFCYFLESDVHYQDAVQEYAAKLNMPIYGISANNDDYLWMKKVVKSGPCEFLWLINHATVVLTNSYHGTIFSLISEVPFYTFERFTNDDPKNENSRIYQLENTFHISQRIIRTSNLHISQNDSTDFDEFRGLLKYYAEHSYRFLSEALSGL